MVCHVKGASARHAQAAPAAQAHVAVQVLPSAMAMAEGCLHACEQEARLELCAAMLQVLAASNDYTRKVACARWYQDLAAGCLS